MHTACIYLVILNDFQPEIWLFTVQPFTRVNCPRLISLAGPEIGAFVYCGESIHARGVLGYFGSCFF